MAQWEGTLRIDVETYSTVDLTKCGAYRYVEDPDFELMLFGFRFNGEEATCHDLMKDPWLPDRVVKAIYDPRILKLAWNAHFEILTIGEHFKRRFMEPLDPKQWRCTMIRAAMCGLPMKLSEAGKAAKVPLDSQKFAYGRQLVKYFCLPCKPTKANGGRTRNLPHHDPEKWKLFTEYCTQDVVSEAGVDDMIMHYPVDEREFARWHADMEINGRGVMVDRQLVSNAIRMNSAIEERNLARMVEITGVVNPKSVDQLKDWLLATDGEEIRSLTKKTMPALIANSSSEAVKEALQLRQETSKSSIKKYEAMDRAACLDGRVRGLLQFYGAQRTGREAGRLVQIQNLRSNTLPDLAFARELVRSGEMGELEMLFGSVPEVLSQLIRTAIIPAPGKKLVVVDEKAIEARVIAWLADEEWRLEVFRTHGMIYEASASAMFHVPMSEFLAYKAAGKKHPLRKRGKVAELACLGPDTLVLTKDRGWVKIPLVTKEDRVWDGLSWVQTEGAAPRGTRETIPLAGVRITADHLVWDGGRWFEAQTVVSSESIRRRSLERATASLRLCGRLVGKSIKTTDEKSRSLKQKLPVYDLKSCGSRSRFTIKTDHGALIVHNCGFQGASNALIRMGALDEGLKIEELDGIVAAWRAASPRISSFDGGLWKRLNDAAFDCVARGRQIPVSVGPRKLKSAVVFELKNVRGRKAMYIRLPSGRPLIYWNPSIRVGGKFKRECVSYEGYREDGLWGQIDTFGGKLAENITQAIARDVLFHVLDKLTKTTIFHVHDEVVLEVPEVTAAIHLLAVTRMMEEPIDWAPGLPLAGEGEIMDWYRKGE